MNCHQQNHRCMNASNKIVCEKATTRLKYEMKMFPAPAVATNEPSLIMNLEQIRLYCRKKTTSNKRSSPFCPFNINIPVKGICLAPKVKSYFKFLMGDKIAILHPQMGHWWKKVTLGWETCVANYSWVWQFIPTWKI